MFKKLLGALLVLCGFITHAQQPVNISHPVKLPSQRQYDTTKAFRLKLKDSLWSIWKVKGAKQFQYKQSALREQAALGEVNLTHYPLRNMLGSNCHEWDFMATDLDFNNPQAKTAAFQKAIVDLGLTGVRDYVDVAPAKTADNAYFHCSPNRRGWRIDSGLLMLQHSIPNFTVLYCYQGAPDTIQADYNNAGEKNSLYVRRGADRTKAESWAEEGHDGYVLAARGGTNPNVRDYPNYIPPNTWETRQTYYKGAGFITIASPANEPDNQWTTTAMNGYGMAAMSASWYDSAKAADPNIIVGSAGVASDDTVYLAQMLDWCKTNSRTKPLFEEYEFHSYGSGMWNYHFSNNLAGGVPPEISTVEGAKRTAAWAALHNITVFVGEHSYDQHPLSWIGIQPISNYTPSERVAYWGLREILGYSVAGVKRAFYYKLYQDWNTAADSSENLFATSSLLVQLPDGSIKRRLIGDCYKQLSQFGDYVYDHTVIDNDSVKLYVFKYGTQSLYTGWTVEKTEEVWLDGHGTAAKFTERFYDVSLPSGTRYDINEDSGGVFKATHFNGGSVTLSSKPFFVLANPAPLPVQLITFTATKQTGQSLLQWKIAHAENFDRFEIERSGDATTFSQIGYQPYSGAENYSLVDNHVLSGNNYYRLKMVDKDGSFKYSPVVKLVFDNSRYDVEVFNYLGQLIKKEKGVDPKQFKQGLEHMNKYILRFSNLQDSYTEKY